MKKQFLIPYLFATVLAFNLLTAGSIPEEIQATQAFGKITDNPFIKRDRALHKARPVDAEPKEEISVLKSRILDAKELKEQLRVQLEEIDHLRPEFLESNPECASPADMQELYKLFAMSGILLDDKQLLKTYEAYQTLLRSKDMLEQPKHLTTLEELREIFELLLGPLDSGELKELQEIYNAKLAVAIDQLLGIEELKTYITTQYQAADLALYALQQDLLALEDQLKALVA